LVERSLDPNVVGFLHRPAVSSRDAIVLTHGAGSNCRTQLLLALAEALAEAGMLVLRCDLPYRQSSPQGPPKPGGAERDREGLGNAVLALRALAPGRIFLGGHSYGGRQSSLLVASRPELVEGLLLLSYPLHPRAGRSSCAHSIFRNCGYQRCSCTGPAIRLGPRKS